MVVKFGFGDWHIVSGVQTKCPISPTASSTVCCISYGMEDINSYSQHYTSDGLDGTRHIRETRTGKSTAHVQIRGDKEKQECSRRAPKRRFLTTQQNHRSHDEVIGLYESHHTCPRVPGSARATSTLPHPPARGLNVFDYQLQCMHIYI